MMIGLISALDVREAINVAIPIMATVALALYVRAILRQLGLLATPPLPPPGPNTRPASLRWFIEAALGWSFVCLGDALRSGIVWDILHFERPGTYAAQIYPLIAALMLLVAGFTLQIKAFTPDHWHPQSIWVPTLAAVLVAVVLNWTLIPS
jgi:hypothetical protein